MLSHTYKNSLIGNYLISSWIVNLQLIYLSSIFIFQNDWLNCYILLFFYCLFGQLPVKPKIPSWLNTVCMLATTVSLFFNLPLLAATTVLFSHWLQGEQPIRPKFIGFNLVLIQSTLATFIMLCIAHLLSYKTTYRPNRSIHYRVRYFKPMYFLLFDQLFVVTLLTIVIWIYVISLPTLEPNALIFSLLPSCFIAYLVGEKKKYIEPFLKGGYISLYIGLAFISQLINILMLPKLEIWFNNLTYLNFSLLVFQQITQATIIGSLLAVFNIQLSTYQTLARKRHTEGFHFIYSMVNIVAIISLSIWITHHNNIYSVANWLVAFTFIGLLITIYRYPASTLKASLKSVVKYLFRIHEVHGLHHLNNLKKPFIIIPNHNSYLEPPILAAMLPGRFMFPINPEAGNMMAVKLTEAFWQKLPMSPNKPMMLKPFVTGLKHCKLGIIFPEGQRSPIGKIGKIYPGASFAAKISQASLVPVILNGSQYHLSSRMKTSFKKVFFPKITIQIGKPLKVQKKSQIGEKEIRNILIDTQCQQHKHKHIKDAIKALVDQIGDKHKCLLSSKKRMSLREVLKATRKISWQHQNVYHVTEENFSVISFLSALLNDIPIIYGDSSKIKNPSNALYHVEHNKVISYSMTEIMNVLYQWTYNSPVYSESNLFIGCDYEDYRIIIFGFIGALLNGATAIIPDKNTGFAQEIYLEHANTLIMSQKYFDRLFDEATKEDLIFVKYTISMHTSSSNRSAWINKFLHPVYTFKYNDTSLLHHFETPFDTIHIR